jgi:hypothetical protein
VTAPQQPGGPRAPAALRPCGPKDLRGVAPPADVVETYARVGVADGAALRVRELVFLWWAREAAGG